MAANSKKSVMDVSKPGKSPADATARPIITGHAMMKDPMVTDDKVPLEGVTEDVPVTSESNTPEEKEAAPSTSHKVIQPLTEETEDKSEEPATDKDDSEEKPETAEESKPEEKKEESPVTEDAVVDAVLDQVGDKKEETKESEEERKRQEVVDKLIEEKKYFVPIDQVHTRRNNRLALLVLGALLPVIIGLGLAADAGVINLGFKVPFDFIKDKTAPSTQTSVTTQPTTTTTPTTKKLTSKAFNFSFSYPSPWTVKDESVKTTDTESLNVTIDTSKAKYALFTVSGKGGDCIPAKTDKAYATTNKCPTYEETAYTKADNGYLVKTKFMDPTTKKTTEHLCFRPKIGIDGKAITVSNSDLNTPKMGFYLECGPSDIWVGTFQNGTQTVFGVFDQPDVADLQTALKTISIDYTK